jgi:hypothetical protein
MKIELFNFEETPVRMVVKDGQPWAVAADVCRALGIENSRQAVNGNEKAGGRGLAEDEKGVCKLDTPGGSQELAIINEPGVYRLIFRSNKPKAEAFRRWVFHEVLPALRQCGNYVLPNSNITLLAWLKEKGVPLGDALVFGKLAGKAARSLGLRTKFTGADEVQYRMYDKTLLDWVWEENRKKTEKPRHGDPLDEDRDKLWAYMAEIIAEAPAVLTFEEVTGVCARLGLFREWVSAEGGITRENKVRCGKWLTKQLGYTVHGVRLLIRGEKRQKRFVWRSV